MGNENGTRLAELAVTMIAPAEAGELVAIIDGLLGRSGAKPDPVAILQRIRDGGHGTAFSSLALYVNRAGRMIEHAPSAAQRAPAMRALLNLRERLETRLAGHVVADAAAPVAAAASAYPPMSVEAGIAKVYQSTVGRLPVAEEIEIWRTNFGNGLPFHEFMLLMAASPEADKLAAGLAIAGSRGDGEFVQLAHERVLGRGAAAWELQHWLNRLEQGLSTRADVLAQLFDTTVKFHDDLAGAPAHDGLSCQVMGTNRFLTAEQWQVQAEDLAGTAPAEDRRYANRFPIRRQPGVLVSALCSLYRGGDFIEQFMDNITSQSCFRDYAELVIVDADSPEDEYETIKRYLARFKNINYMRMNYRLGIYDAWNVAAKAARGEYLTNTNLDDLRRHDSLEIQAGALDNLPFVDVVYQDLFYSFDPRLPFEQVAAFGHETQLPVITPHNMIKYNSPHNAPMWRKRLHDELGWFDIRYKSAGDYDFWMRCLAAGKTFYKINDPHVVYYQNPKGLSTRPDTRGVVEAMDIHKAYCRKLVPAEAVVSTDEFRRALGNGPLPPGRDRYHLAQAALRNVARAGKFRRGQENAS